MRTNEISMYADLERVRLIQDQYRKNNKLRQVSQAKECKKEFINKRNKLVKDLGSDDPEEMVKLVAVMIKGLKKEAKNLHRKLEYVEESRVQRKISILRMVIKEARKQIKINKDPSDY